MESTSIQAVRIPGREVPATRGQVPSHALRAKMVNELTSLLATKRGLIVEIADKERRLQDVDMSINAAADMIAQIDRASLTQRLADDVAGDGNQG